MSITQEAEAPPVEMRIVRGSSKPDVYAGLLDVARYVEFHSGPAYCGFSPLELRLMLEEPGGPKWPAQVKPKDADRRIARMLGLPPGKQGKRKAAAMREDLRHFKWVPLHAIVSERMYRSHLRYLWKNHRLVPTGKGRYRLNQVFDAERLAMMRKRPSRYLLRPEIWPPLGYPLAVNLREDLVPEEEAVLHEIGVLMRFVGEVLSRLQGIDKTRFPAARKKRVRESHKAPWGASRHGPAGEYLALVQGTASIVSKPWTEEEYLPRIEYLVARLRRVREQLPTTTANKDWLLDKPRKKIRA